jgi:acyl-[acyl-carrier-protein] desaturase
VDGTALLYELAPVAERLHERHLRAAKEWFPHELVRWERAIGEGGTDELPAGVRSALLVNVLTEDALPYYTTGLANRLGDSGPWWDWIRRWTAEEMRHGTMLHDYLSVTGVLDLVDLERRRMQYLSTASVPTSPSVLDALAYLALQELATRIAHANTARLLPDAVGRRVVARVAADEHLHHLFYRDVVSAALEVDPSATVLAIDRQVRHFSMPGREIPGFDTEARAIADAGIYSTEIYLDHVAVPLVFAAWQLDSARSINAEATAARDRTLRFVERLRRIAPRLSASAEAPLDV